jgi:uncharacterized protein YcfL
MKKVATICMIAMLCFLLAGCSSNNETDIGLENRSYYIDSDDCWLVTSYNGYTCISIDKEQDANGVSSVTLVFDKLNK